MKDKPEKSEETKLFEKAIAIMVEELNGTQTIDPNQNNDNTKITIDEKKIDIVNLFRSVDFNKISLPESVLENYNKIPNVKVPTNEEFQQKINGSDFHQKQELADLSYPLKKAIYSFTEYKNEDIEKLTKGDAASLYNLRKIVVDFAVAQQGLNQLPQMTIQSVSPDLNYDIKYFQQNEEAKKNGNPIPINSKFGHEFTQPSITDPSMKLKYEEIKGKFISPLSANSNRKYVIDSTEIIVNKSEKIDLGTIQTGARFTHKTITVYTAIDSTIHKHTLANEKVLDKLVDQTLENLKDNNKKELDKTSNKIVSKTYKKLKDNKKISLEELEKFNKAAFNILNTSTNKEKIQIILEKIKAFDYDKSPILELKPKDVLYHNISKLTEKLDMTALSKKYKERISVEGQKTLESRERIKEIKKTVKEIKIENKNLDRKNKERPVAASLGK